jgi:MoaA/NifB/PqqE/SkfB family radical SAM enzyme
MKSLLSPEQITFFVTDRCNLSCSHCFLSKEGKVKDEELTTNEIDNISKRIGRISYVTITGGEPFLREDIVEIVKILNKNLRPSLITILTNGYMTNTVTEKVNEILENSSGQNILVKVSLDGPAKIHDAMREKLGSFDCARTTFVKLRNLKKTYRNLSLGIITTYTNQNKDYLENFYEEEISGLAPDQYGLTLERSDQANELNEKIDIDDYIRVFKRINMKTLSSTKGFFRKFRLAYKMKMADILKEIYLTKRYPIKCFAGTLNAVISPNGAVFSCEQLKTKLGSLKEEDYDWNKIWHSAGARRVRDLIKKRICFCTNECYLPFNLSYDIKQFLGLFRIFIKNILIYGF